MGTEHRETEGNETQEHPVPTCGWVCFHCNEVFTEREAAAEHFGNGDYETEIPLCVEAATTEQKQLILTNREMWERLQGVERENEDLEEQAYSWSYVARKLTKKPSATSHDLEHEWDFMEGRVIAAESVRTLRETALRQARNAAQAFIDSKNLSTARAGLRSLVRDIDSALKVQP